MLLFEKRYQNCQACFGRSECEWVKVLTENYVQQRFLTLSYSKVLYHMRNDFWWLFTLFIFLFVAAEISLVACDKNEKVATLLSNMEETPHLKTIVVMETASQSNIQHAAELKIDLVQFSDLEVDNWLFLFLFSFYM